MTKEEAINYIRERTQGYGWLANMKAGTDSGIDDMVGMNAFSLGNALCSDLIRIYNKTPEAEKIDWKEMVDRIFDQFENLSKDLERFGYVRALKENRKGELVPVDTEWSAH